MWNRKDLKNKAKELLKKNYWSLVVVCFILAILTGEFGTSILGMFGQDNKNSQTYIIYSNKESDKETLEEDNQINEKIEKKNKFWNTLNDTQKKLFEAVKQNVDDMTKSQKYIYKLWDAVNAFLNNSINLGITLVISATLSFLFIVFIADPLIVGGKVFFLNTASSKSTKIVEIFSIFKKEKWFNIAYIMFVRNILTALWYLTIIGGVIKTYEYRMIPYILAQNPTIKRKEAFALSKQMMKNNKWKTFILDLSFFGWDFLSVLTMGLLSVFYVNSYSSLTNVQLYLTLKKKVIEEKCESYEMLEK